MSLHTAPSIASASSSISNIAGPNRAVVATATGSAPPTLLPNPTLVAFSNDVGAEVAALALQAGQAQQDIDTKSAETEDSVQNQADAAEVATMHQEASATRAGAWVSGMFQIAAGAATIGSASCATGSTASGVLKGLGDALNGGSTIAGGLSKAAATDLDASATASKALADAAERGGSIDRDAQKSAQTFVQTAIEFFREYESTKAQAQAAALHGA